MTLYRFGVRTRIKTWARRVRGSLRGFLCPACGVKGILKDSGLDWPELFRQWELEPEWARSFREREALQCEWCDANLRSRSLASALVSALAPVLGAAPSLAALCAAPAASRLRVAEINAAAGLHPFLSLLPGLVYSEFGTADRHEDLSRLSYADESFDLVITSDTLEHVPDWRAALSETRRVLKAEGLHVFTVPVVTGRPTRQRARLEGGKVVHILPPSYHGGGEPDMLVFNEFGDDFVDECRGVGFEVSKVADADNPALVAFVARRR